jgi:hypothetical protein
MYKRQTDIGWWWKTTDQIRKSMRSFPAKELKNSWEHYEQLPPAEVGDAILYFTSRFVREDRVHEFLSAYFTLMPVKKSVFRAARIVHGLTHLADSTHLKLERTFTACIHYPLPGRPVAFKVQGRSIELTRLFQIQGPGLAIYTGRATVAWFLNATHEHYVLHRE